MKVNAVFLSENKFKKNLNDTNSLYFVTGILTVSVFLSILFYVFFSEQIDSVIGDEFIKYFNMLKSKSKPVSFADLLLPYLFFHMVVILSSTSIIGDVVITILSCLRISGLTILVLHIYSTYRLIGIEYAFLILFPGKLFYILSVILIMKTGYHTVNSIKRKDKDRAYGINENIARYVFSVIIMLLSVVIDYVTVSSFADLFSF